MQSSEELKAQIEKAVRGSEGTDDEMLRFPLSLGEPRLDKDHSGGDCTVLDVIFSPDVLRTAEASRQVLRHGATLVHRTCMIFPYPQSCLLCVNCPFCIGVDASGDC